MQAFGLDIGSSVIKLIEVARSGGRARLVTAAAAASPLPGIRSESVTELTKLSETIKKLVSDARVTTSQVFCALPESGVHVEVIEMPPMSESELSAAIVWEAEQVIPFQVSDAEISWQVISVPDKAKNNRQQVLVAAAPKKLVEKYAAVLVEAGLSPQALEPESMAVARTFSRPGGQATLILGLGASGTDISIVRDSSTVVSRNLPTGGDAITRALGSYLNLEPKQAEEYKRAYGLSENQLEGKVRQAILPVADVILGEARKVIEFFQTKNEGQRVNSVILTGGGAGLPDLVPYLARGLGLEVVIGEPFAGIDREERMIQILSGYGPLYAVAVGLALRDFEG